jgi:hypothetical protein
MSSVLAQGLVIFSDVKIDLGVINISWVFLNTGSVQELSLLRNTIDADSRLSSHTRLMVTNDTSKYCRLSLTQTLPFKTLLIIEVH